MARWNDPLGACSFVLARATVGLRRPARLTFPGSIQVTRALGSLLVALTLLGLSQQLSAQPQDSRQLLDFVRNVHQTSRRLIQTCSCRVEFKNDITYLKPTKRSVTQTCSSKYWYSENAVRVEVLENNQNTQYVWKDSVRKSIVRRSSGGREAVAAGRDSYASRHLTRCDAWTQGLLVLNVPGTIDCVPFEQFESRASRVTKAERIGSGGKEMIVVHLFFEGSDESSPPWNAQIHFDPTVNYLIRRTVYETAPGARSAIRREHEVLHFKENTPGLYFPERIAGHSEGVDTYSASSATEILDIAVNRPLPEGTFRLRFPHGVRMTDGIRGVSYEVDSDGNQISRETRMGWIPPPPLAEPDTSNPMTESQEDPAGIIAWILPISLVILALAGVLAVARRLRSSARGG